MSSVDQTPGPVLLFDGECGLCQRLVRLLLRLDRRGRLRFAPLQSGIAQTYLRQRGLPTRDFDSLVFVRDWSRREEAPLLRTDGAIAALRACRGGGGIAAVLPFIPSSWRDVAYRLVARLRYRVFGPWKGAPVPAQWSHRFIG